MRNFENIKEVSIIKKQIVSIKAKEKPEFSGLLDPEETITVCNCLVNVRFGSKLLITGIKYPSLKWEHVLVRAEGRYPTHREMVMAKELFWYDSEMAFQVYPPESENINYEKFTLHLWRDLEFSDVDEVFMKKTIHKCYHKAKKKFDGTKKTISILDEYGSRIVVYGPMCWIGWEDLVMEKEIRWGKKGAAIQIFDSKDLDDNPKYITMIWDAKNFRLPPKELV